MSNSNSAELIVTETAVTMPSLPRDNRFDKRPHKVLPSVCDELSLVCNELSSLQTRINNCGEGIVTTTLLADKDFLNILTSIHRIYESLNDVQTLEASEFQRESMNRNEGTVLQQVEESEETTLGAVLQSVVENPVVVLQPSKRWLWWWRSNKRKSPRVIVKRLKH